MFKKNVKNFSKKIRKLFENARKMNEDPGPRVGRGTQHPASSPIMMKCGILRVQR